MDKKEFEQVFKDNYRQMYRLAMSILADKEESHDVVHDVFARLLEGWYDVKKETIPSYLLTCVRNQCLNVLRRKGSRNRFEQIYSAQLEAVAYNNEYSDEMERLRAFINARFTDRMKQVFQMKYFEGMTYREISQELGISEVAVYKNLAHCLEDVKTNYKSSRYGQ